MIHRPAAFTTEQLRMGHLAAAVLLAGLDVAVLGAVVALAMLVS